MKQNFLALKLLRFTFSSTQQSMAIFFLTASVLILGALAILNSQHLKLNSNIIEILALGASAFLLPSSTLMTYILTYTTLTYFTFMLTTALNLPIHPILLVLAAIGVSYAAAQWISAKYA